jgi:hypothetical protein
MVGAADSAGNETGGPEVTGKKQAGTGSVNGFFRFRKGIRRERWVLARGVIRSGRFERLEPFNPCLPAGVSCLAGEGWNFISRHRDPMVALTNRVSWGLAVKMK